MKFNQDVATPLFSIHISSPYTPSEFPENFMHEIFEQYLIKILRDSTNAAQHAPANIFHPTLHFLLISANSLG